MFPPLFNFLVDFFFLFVLDSVGTCVKLNAAIFISGLYFQNKTTLPCFLMNISYVNSSIIQKAKKLSKY